MHDWLMMLVAKGIPPAYLPELDRYDSPEQAAQESSHMVALLWLLWAKCEDAKKYDVLNDALLYVESEERAAALALGPQHHEQSHATWKVADALAESVTAVMQDVLPVPDPKDPHDFDKRVLSEQDRQACQKSMDQWLDSKGGREQLLALLAIG